MKRFSGFGTLLLIGVFLPAPGRAQDPASLPPAGAADSLPAAEGVAPLAASGRTSPRCEVMQSDSVRIIEMFAGERLIQAAGPVISCDDGTEVRADSAEVNESMRVTRLFGNVDFTDPSQRLRSTEAEFHEVDDRLQATGSVVLVRASDGSVIRGEFLEYLRAGSLRTEDRIRVWGGRTRSSIPPANGEGPPWEVVSDEILIAGEDSVLALGEVELVRDSLDARSDTLVLQSADERLLFAGSSRIRGARYDLSASRIELELPGDTLRGVVASHEALLQTEDLRLTTPGRIRIDLENDEPVRLVAVELPPPSVEEEAPSGVPSAPPPPVAPLSVPDSTLPEAERPRPRAESADFLLTGDSLDIEAPGGRARRALASGDGWARSMRPDTTLSDEGRRALEELPPILRHDWMAGETIEAFFVEAGPDSISSAPDSLSPAPDSTASGPGGERPTPTIERLVATGSARSFVRVPPADSARSARGERALHYVRGRVITLFLTDGAVDRMEVDDPSGIHLEPGSAGPTSGAGPGEGPPPSSSTDGGGSGLPPADPTPPPSGSARER